MAMKKPTLASFHFKNKSNNQDFLIVINISVTIIQNLVSVLEMKFCLFLNKPYCDKPTRKLNL